MKIIILKTVKTLIAMIISVSVFGQVSERNTTFQKFDDQFTSDISGLTNFTYTVVDKKVFFNLTVKNLKEDCVFVIERSINGDKYKSIALKMGRANDKNIDLLYSFQDSLNFESDKASYRLKQVFETTGTYYTESYTIKNDQYFFLADFK